MIDCTYQGSRLRVRMALAGHPEPVVAAAPSDAAGLASAGARVTVAHRGHPLHVLPADARAGEPARA